MRGKLYFLGFIVLVVSYTQIIDSPLNSLAAFIIAGDIPGTKISLGFWATIGLAFIILSLLTKWLSHIKLDMLENKAKTITAENLAKDFKESSAPEVATKNISVIAAPDVRVLAKTQ